MRAEQRVVGAILGEHRAMSAVLEALSHIASAVEKGSLEPDYAMLWSLIYYIDQYPERHHHPMEEQALFPAVRARTDGIDDVLADLGRQHASSRGHLEEVRAALGNVQAGIPGARQAFATRAASYAQFQQRHMKLEESRVLPTAIEVLSDDDWSALLPRFEGHADPLDSPAMNSNEWFRGFFRRLVSIVPQPWGVGGRR